MNEDLIHKALQSWRSLNEVLMYMTEAELLAALNIEKTYKRRKQLLLAIHRRYSRKRRDRERAELLELCE